MSKRVEEIVRRFVAELQTAFLKDAVEMIGKRSRGSVTAPASVAPAGKRTQKDLDKLATQFLRFVCAGGSGYTIEQLARGLGLDTKELLLPIKKLKGQYLIRTTGHKRSTRYYPTPRGALSGS